MKFKNADFVLAFPASVRDDALRVASIVALSSLDTKTFSVHVGCEKVLIPYRVNLDSDLLNPTQFTPLQVNLFNCLLTRHNSVFIREKHLKNVIRSNHEWI